MTKDELIRPSISVMSLFYSNTASLLPPGEGQDEGVQNHAVITFDPLSPVYTLPEGEGVNGTAVEAYCLFVITMYRQMKKMKKAECPLYSEARSDAPAAAV
jgi:hypothetical protein